MNVYSHPCLVTTDLALIFWMLNICIIYYIEFLIFGKNKKTFQIGICFPLLTLHDIVDCDEVGTVTLRCEINVITLSEIHVSFHLKISVFHEYLCNNCDILLLQIYARHEDYCHANRIFFSRHYSDMKSNYNVSLLLCTNIITSSLV